jgi:hypothetical protein
MLLQPLYCAGVNAAWNANANSAHHGGSWSARGVRPADPSGGRIHLDPEETIVSTDAVVPTGLASTTELVLEGLQDGGRLLLMIAMTLFLSYFLFMLGAVLFSTTADRVRYARVRHRRDELEDLRSARVSRSAPQRISA